MKTAMENSLQDLRFGLRWLLKTPGFTLVALLTLTLGIAANSVIFSVVNAALFRWADEMNDPDRLVMVWQARQDTGLWAPTPADFRDWRERSHVFEGMAAYYYGSFNLSGSGEPEKIQGAWISASLFPLIGVQPALGRSMLPEEVQWGRHRVALLSDGLWRRRFGADRAILGRQISLNGEPFTIVGVMPPGAWFAGTPVELWALLAVFAAVAVMLAGVGIYGVVSYTVSRRTQEIGIRMALGAQRHEIERLVVGESLAVALAGIAAGVAASLALTRLIASLVFGVSPTDPLTFGCVALVLTGVALLASWIPARRASRVGPMVALRYE